MTSTGLLTGVLTGAGGTFCAGADLGARRPVSDEHGFGSVTRRQRKKPLLTAIEGHAVGGGMELALACDLVVAARDASFGLPKIRHAIFAALTGDPINAVRAHEVGLVNELTKPGARRSVAGERRSLRDRQKDSGRTPVSAVTARSGESCWRRTHGDRRKRRDRHGWRRRPG
ncbi:enoyl-CoA hydratase/carnithine racemase [Amycolatopsis bartoniae]|uniref:Enoyl-CoA hydratase/isomerase family protein n=1 Tax=Amycolatopsis bartoniae TaxID=941986 RepID=A0A8H9M8U2_9PSEU|nr:enoyl-CoA hydratase-related protein [Amycolatopsis bartoniae]MBB2939660.1 enoyl-CoA hydratase/carnithine racemase [Amycolatopsis bartoniae]TVT06233.1 hypothetical protein FNH07_20750 [Amycolatopsis bartoniae]GHF36702.1 hypothetical protein GCM10017566_07270 [Amycolatopsis bartoniae]